MLQGEDHGSQFIISVSSNMDRTLQSITIMVDTVPPEDGIWNQQDNSSRVDFIVGNGSGSSSDTPFEFVGVPESVPYMYRRNTGYHTENRFSEKK